MSGLAIDRARVWKGARTVGRVGWAVAKSVGHFAFGILLLGSGAWAVWTCGGVLLQPDAAILQIIADRWADAPPDSSRMPPSLVAERTVWLAGFTAGLSLALFGFACIQSWWDSLPPFRIRRGSKQK